MSNRFDQLKDRIKKIADADAAEHQALGVSTDPVGSANNPSTQILTPANIITFCRLILTVV